MIAVTSRPAIALDELAAMAGGTLSHAGSATPVVITGASIDTRTIAPGDLFVPLPGRHTDGHDHLAEAFRRGAAAALCARDRAGGVTVTGPLVVVDDVTAALQRLAHQHRRRWNGRVVAITGSSGKTTTKDLLAVAIGSAMPTLATAGNLNNHWGVPLTLLRLGAEHRAAVIEIGTSAPGEIAALAAIAVPDVAVITNVGSAHLEFFGSVEAVAREKASLAHALDREGTAVVGADSAPLMAAMQGARCRVVTFGLGPDADVRPRRVLEQGPSGTRFEVDGFPPVALALVGRHQVLNGLAALATARVLALDPDAVVKALAAVRPGKGRMEVKHARGATLLVDCYNANPESMRGALETLATWPDARRRIAVLGDMLELGAEAAALHRQAGGAVRDAELWVTGAYAADYAAGARASGTTVREFSDTATLGAALARELGAGTVVLLKASRGAALERVLEPLGGEG